MKKLLLALVLALCVGVGIAQSYTQVNGDSYALNATAISFTAITSADTTNYVYSRDSSEITWAYTTSGIAGTDSVVVRLEGSEDGVRWMNLDDDGDRTITTNTTGGWRFVGLRTVPYTRFRVVRVVGTLSVSAITARVR